MSGAQDGGTAATSSRDFTVVSQKLELDIDFATRTLKGSTDIIIAPQSKDLKRIRLNGRQCRITWLTVEGKAATLGQQDPYIAARPHPSYNVHQHHLLRAKIEPQLRNPPEEELNILLPKSLQIKELDPFSSTTPDALSRTGKPLGGGANLGEIPATATVSEQTTQFANLKINIKWEVTEARDGLQWVGFSEEDSRYPHVYSRNSGFPGTACSIFPCIDDPTMRCIWYITIKTPRTLGDAFRPRTHINGDTAIPDDHKHSINGDSASRGLKAALAAELLDDDYGFNERENAMEIAIVCSGTMEEAEIEYPDDPSCKGVYFVTESAVSANQIGFAVGPFEVVELSQYRETEDDDKLGAQAVRVHGFCLPGRAEEVRNTCMPLAKALDFFTTTYTAYPSGSYKLCFVDDLAVDTVATIGFCLCSSRLLFPEDILEPLDTVTRKLIRALAEQYSGISLAPREPSDTWIVAGMASFMADVFMRQLSGNNEYRFRQKAIADQVHELDIERPALYSLGAILYLDRSEAEFLALKAGVVFFILDRRLIKSSGSTGIGRIIGRILTNAKAADVDSTMISTAQFQRQCEKMGHIKLDAFFQQWVYGAGCPTFYVTQRFNKKRLVVEMMIRQGQLERESITKDLDPSTFLRDVKEENAEVYAGVIQPVFTGPMTIRIHEADGTPYEHIVDIKEGSMRFDIPYNTKYKRLKRNKRQKDRINSSSGMDDIVETENDVLLYCLGDVLQSQDEVSDWRLSDWSKEDEERMNQESYEWIRMDADFEWICKMHINMPAYMFVSQLQQDRDVVAQMETLQYMAAQKEHPLISTILTRTIMDRRYFHGIRTMAIAGLARCAKDELDWIGLFHLERIFQDFFCFPDSPMTRPNDFSDRTAFLIQCAIPNAIAGIRDNSGRAPLRVQRFFFDKLKFNDNTDNEFSDVHYVATLMRGLAKSLASSVHDSGFEDEEDDDELIFRREAIKEIERYRRIDEWISSFQNLYSSTALECLQRLAQGRLLPLKLRDFLQYARPGNADVLRIKAVDCLVEAGTLTSNAIFKYMVYILSADSSPYIREHTLRIFGRGLGKLAMGEKKADTSTQPMDGLIIEQDASTDARQSDLARRQTITGAMAALKADIGENEAIKQAIWAAVSSPVISLNEMADLLDICAAIYEPQSSLHVTLKYPRYWRAAHVGSGKVKFTRTGSVRTTKIKPMQWTTAQPAFTPAKPAATPGLVPPVPKALKLSSAPSRKPSTITLNGVNTNNARDTHSTHSVSTISLLPPTSTPTPASAIFKKSHSPEARAIPVTAPQSTAAPERPQHILKLKFKGPLPPNPPAKYPGSSFKTSSTAINGSSHNPSVIRLSTPVSAKSPSPSPFSSTGRAMTPPVRASTMPSLSSQSSKPHKHRKQATPALATATAQSYSQTQTPMFGPLTNQPTAPSTSTHTATTASTTNGKSHSTSTPKTAIPKKRKNSSPTDDLPLKLVSKKAAKDGAGASGGGVVVKKEDDDANPPPLVKKPTLKLKFGGGGGAGSPAPGGK